MRSRRQVGQVYELSRFGLWLVLIWPGLVWLGGDNEEEEQPGAGETGRRVGPVWHGLVWPGMVMRSRVGCPWLVFVLLWCFDIEAALNILQNIFRVNCQSEGPIKVHIVSCFTSLYQLWL